MPRRESLAAIVPNRYYDLQATVKYLHQTEKGTTAIIEQDEVQRKIMIPRTANLEEGAEYRFPKCFCSRNGWIKVKETTAVEKVERVIPEESMVLTLEQVNERRTELFNNYITTTLQIVSIGAPENKQKNGNELTLTLVKGFAQNALVDITIWNQDFPQAFLGKTVNLDGFRVKMLTNNTFVLVSTVFSKITLLHDVVEPVELQYHSDQFYPSYSQVYSERTIRQMRQTLKDLTKCFSIIQAKITEATVFDYEGCTICHKKLEGDSCSHCNAKTQKQTFWVCQLDVEDETDNCTLYVFSSDLQSMLQHAQKGSVIRTKIRSTMRLDASEETNLESHTLTGILSIQF